MTLKGRDIISFFDFSREEVEYLFRRADELESLRRGETLNVANGKIVAVIFFEPSTRTRLSFTMAVKRLGGDVLDFGEVQRTSVAKGETLADTIKMIDGYKVDLIVLRHPSEGASKLAAEFAEAPVINAGDGSREHPTQTLLDLYTIWREFKHIDNLNIGIMGDLKYGRTPSSLSYGLSLFSNVKIYYIAPEILQIREEVLEMVERKIRYEKIEKLQDAINELDVLYVTRIQKERLPNPEEYEKLKGLYTVTPSSLEGCKENLIVMHPLPRVTELSPEVDSTKHARYFQQAVNGMVIRAALIKEILGLEG